MLDVSTRVAGLREHLHGRWTPEREQRVWERISRSEHARRRAAVVVVVAFAAAAVLMVAFWRQPSPRATSPESASPRSDQTLADGSAIRWLRAGARLETLEDGPRGTRLRLQAGAARFEVTPRRGRPFEVLAGDTVIEVVGTVFSVGIEPSSVNVSVERGRVRVRSPEGTRELGAGEQARFERGPAAPEVISPPAPASSVAPEPSAQRARSWRNAAQDGDYKAALKLLDSEGPRAVRDDPADLMLASDAARLGGHPERAVVWLEHVGTRHPGSSLAPLAAFTLGRVLLEQLGRPSEAAQAFGRAQRGGALAEDALAREVESWARAGETSRARERAAEYERRFPNGRRLKAVRAHAGTERASEDPG